MFMVLMMFLGAGFLFFFNPFPIFSPFHYSFRQTAVFPLSILPYFKIYEGRAEG